MLQKKQAMAAVSGLVILTTMAWSLKKVVPVFFPELFMRSSPPAAAAPVATLPAATTAAGATPSPEQLEAEDALAELTSQVVARDPVAAVRRLAKLTADHSGAPVAKPLEARLAEVRAEFKPALEAADQAARAEIARVVSSAAPRLAVLEHRSVIVELRALEARFAGLPAASVATAERTRIQSEWDTMPTEEKTARERYAKIPASFRDDADRADGAAFAFDVATTCSGTRCGLKASERCAQILDSLWVSLDSLATTSRDKNVLRSALAATKRLPAALLRTPAGGRVAEAAERIKARLEPR